MVLSVFSTSSSRHRGLPDHPLHHAVGTESADAATIEAWIAQARLEDDGSLAFKQGIENLQALLASLIPEEDRIATQLSESV